MTLHDWHKAISNIFFFQLQVLSLEGLVFYSYNFIDPTWPAAFIITNHTTQMYRLLLYMI